MLHLISILLKKRKKNKLSQLKKLNTTFNENVLVKYLNNRLSGEILDFYFNTNIAVMSKNVFYNNSDTKFFADKVEFDLSTKDTKISMDKKIEKVKIINQYK